MTRGKDFFLVTDFQELGRQPDLKKSLSAFPVYAQGDSYISMICAISPRHKDNADGCF